MSGKRVKLIPFYITKAVATLNASQGYFIYGKQLKAFKVLRLVATWLQVGATTNNVQPVYGGAISGSGCCLSYVFVQISPLNAGGNNELMGDIADSYSGVTGETGFRTQFYQPGEYQFENFQLNDGICVSCNFVNQTAETINYSVSGYLEIQPLD